MLIWDSTKSSGYIGSNFSLELHNVCTDELNYFLATSRIGCHMSDQCYADDFVLFAPSAKATQRFLNICSTYANEHGTIFNSLKTACMVFCPRCLRNLNVRKFTFDGVELEFREEVTYSGHVNHNYLKDGLYIRKQLQKFNAAWNLLVRKFTVCSKKVK